MHSRLCGADRCPRRPNRALRFWRKFANNLPSYCEGSHWDCCRYGERPREPQRMCTGGVLQRHGATERAPPSCCKPSSEKSHRPPPKFATLEPMSPCVPRLRLPTVCQQKLSCDWSPGPCRERIVDGGYCSQATFRQNPRYAVGRSKCQMIPPRGVWPNATSPSSMHRPPFESLCVARAMKYAPRVVYR